MADQARKMLAWRKRQRAGRIMRPATFERIKREAMGRYGIGEERGEKVAGKAYWRTARAKYRGRRKRGGDRGRSPLKRILGGR